MVTSASGGASSPAPLMAGGGRLRCCSGAREERRGRGFIGPTTRRGGFARASWPTGAMAWARRRRRRAEARRPMAEGGSPASECGEAAWHWPRPPARVMSLRCTVVMAPASDRGVSWCLGMRTRSGYDGVDVACRDTTSRTGSPGSKTIQSGPV
jgi:hypothetical protein